MEEYDYEPDWSWAEEFVGPDGQVDQAALLEAMEENPELMAKLQEMYMMYPDDYNSYADPGQPPEPQSILELYTDCVLPNVSGAAGTVAMLLLVCLVCNLVSRCLGGQRRALCKLVHISLGVATLCSFFQSNAVILFTYCAVSTTVLLLKPLRVKMGVVTSLSTLATVIGCELTMEPERWHSVRGAQMIMSMKVISLAFDLSNERVKDANGLEILSYLLHPSSVIFGPWISYSYFTSAEDGCLSAGLPSLPADLAYLWRVVSRGVVSLACLVWSTCVIGWLIPAAYAGATYWDRWLAAYRDAQSFRFSHYFICTFSELTLLLSGVHAFTSGGKLNDYTVVSQPISIELPRSLVEVVTCWNLPMHYWLKTYVFKVSRPRLGTFAAVLSTYLASSLLHGLNFQLAAVLLSLGFYSYVEHSLRLKLSDTFSCCIQARPCKAECGHARAPSHPYSLALNLLFGGLSVYHLAYLGVMFDTSDGEQERGYSMLHTLSKWSNLGYGSHLVAASTFLFYFLIR